MLRIIITIAEQLLELINHYLSAQEAVRENVKASDKAIDEEVQSEKNEVKALGLSVSNTLAALQRVRDAESRS